MIRRLVRSLNSSLIWSLSLQLAEYNSQQRKCRKIFLEAIFSHWNLLHKIFVIILRDIIVLENSFCLSVNRNPELRV